MISSKADKRNTKRVGIIAASGILAALAIAGLCACAAAYRFGKEIYED